MSFILITRFAPGNSIFPPHTVLASDPALPVSLFRFLVDELFSKGFHSFSLEHRWLFYVSLLSLTLARTPDRDAGRRRRRRGERPQARDACFSHRPKAQRQVGKTMETRGSPRRTQPSHRWVCFARKQESRSDTLCLSCARTARLLRIHTNYASSSVSVLMRIFSLQSTYHPPVAGFLRGPTTFSAEDSSPQG